MLATANPHAFIRLAAAAVAGAALLCGCSTNHTVTGGKDSVTQPDNQSETAATVAKVGATTRLSVAYNDETGQGAKIKFADEFSRLALAGASQMGWSWSDDGGKTWTHGGPLAPPKGFSILWGDPAMATSGSKASVVFLSSLAVPDAKMPPGGVSGSFVTGTVTSPIGGACISKSTDGGKGFAQWRCVQNKAAVAGVAESVNGHFYDGGALASTPTGEVFAGYVDVVTGRIDVWRSPDENGSFTMLANPFPGLVMVSHPRMRVGPDGVLYIAAQALVGDNAAVAVFMTRLVGGAWAPAKAASQVGVLYPSIDYGSTVQGSALTVRTGPQFGFDVGAASDKGNDAVRVMATRVSGGRLFIEGSACKADLGNCHVLSGWQLGPSSPGATPLDNYNPDVVAWWGDKTHEATWQTSFMERFGSAATTVNVGRGTLGYVNGNSLIVPVDIAKDVPVCSDRRGYFGDYDGMILTGPGKSGMNWMRFYTDASNACSKRWTFIAREQHVSQASYEY